MEFERGFHRAVEAALALSHDPFAYRAPVSGDRYCRFACFFRGGPGASAGRRPGSDAAAALCQLVSVGK